MVVEKAKGGKASSSKKAYGRREAKEIPNFISLSVWGKKAAGLLEQCVKDGVIGLSGRIFSIPSRIRRK